MSLHARNERLLIEFLDLLSCSEGGDIEGTLRAYRREDVIYEVFHPCDALKGVEAAASAAFLGPLQAIFRDDGRRPEIAIGGDDEGRARVWPD